MCHFSPKGKAQMNAQNQQGLSPLHLAAHEGYDKMAKILIENGNLKKKFYFTTTFCLFPLSSSITLSSLYSYELNVQYILPYQVKCLYKYKSFKIKELFFSFYTIVKAI